jgi:6-pyruvoyl tetrahydropterin synthase
MTEGSSSTGGAEFEVFVGKEDFKFSAAHFVAFNGFRERLHGHNYQVAVRLKGQQVGMLTIPRVVVETCALSKLRRF